LGLSLTLAHVDHGLRPTSALDCRAAEALAARLGLPLEVERVQVGREGGVEAAARRVRYAALQRMARATGCRFVAVAHTRTDQAETVLLRLLRGSGLRGLSAMAPTRKLAAGVWLARPMLGISRRQVRQYAQQEGLPTFEDPTNQELRFLRNALRLEVWPALERLSPALEVRLASLAEGCREDEAALSSLARAAQIGLVSMDGEEMIMPRRALAALPAPVAHRVLRDVIRRLRPAAPVSAVHLRNLLTLVRSRKGAELHLAGNLRAKAHQGVLRLGPRPPRPSRLKGEEGGLR
jgi:tRNA(Ile)-lysidine synthase